MGVCIHIYIWFCSLIPSLRDLVPVKVAYRFVEIWRSKKSTRGVFVFGGLIDLSMGGYTTGC